MNRSQKAFRLISMGSLLAFAGMSANAQTQGPGRRITQEIDEANLVRLRGNVHPLARPEFDEGVVPDSRPMNRMLLLLVRSPEQQAALSKLMEEQLSKSSPNFHKWLTPEEFGKRFGPADEDIKTVTEWLGSHGFQGIKVAKGRTTVEFSGSVAQVRNTFHTDIHRFTVKGEEHVANVSDPQIPAALSPVVAGVVSLHNFRKKSHAHPVGVYRRTRATGELKPLFTFTPNGQQQQFAVGPPDFATIYDVPNGLNGKTKTLDGTGTTIAIVGRSNINTADINAFHNLFGLPAANLNVILNGPDPGTVGAGSIGGEETEADIDTQWSSAVAPGATIDFVVTETPQTNASDGTDLSALYIVENNLADVLSESFGGCEFLAGTAGNQFLNALWEEAAAQGTSVTVAAGDNGSAGCDGGTETAATFGLAVGDTASTPFNVAVGGTDFDDVANASTFWQTTATSSTAPIPASAKGYIPETTWNQSCAANGINGCSTVNSNGQDLAAGSGGPSNCISSDGQNLATCSGGYAKPAYQKLAIPGIPADGVRDTPDVSLFASNGVNNSAYIVCQADTNNGGASCDLNSPFQDFILIGGTSVSAPSFAGVLALVNEATGERQGNANVVLYQLAAAETFANCNSSNRTNPATAANPACVFNDISTQAKKSTISVACQAGSPNCSNTGNSGFGVLVNPSNKSQEAWDAGPGYDLATGLGSVDVTNLANAWKAKVTGTAKTSTTTTFTINALATPVTIAHGSTVNVAFTVTPGSGAAKPNGEVVLVANPNPSTANPAQTPNLAFPLVSGACSPSPCQTNLLPGGIYTLAASYAGDQTFGASSSTPISMTVTQESSQTKISLIAFDANGNPSTQTSVPYGSAYVLLANVTNSSGTPCAPATGTVITTSLPCPSGEVTITDNGNPLNDFNGGNSTNLSNQGIAEDQPVQLPAGKHALVAAYAGDNSFGNSTSPTDNVTITKAVTTMTLTASPSSIVSGSMVTLTATVSTQSSGVAPGTGVNTPVQFLNGSTPITGTITLTPANAGANPASLTATITTTITALGFPENPSPRSPKFPPPVYWLFAACLAAFAWFLRKTPPARRRGYAYAGLILFALAAAGIVGCGGGGSSAKPARMVTLTAKFVGDANYMASPPGTTTVSVQ